jgi:hypothetical protein
MEKERLIRLTRRESLILGGAAIVNFLFEKSVFKELLGEEERLKTPEELRVESIIERTYQSYSREIVIGGRKFLLRIPFGQCAERFPSQEIFMGGKGDPENLWKKIGKLLNEPNFVRYQEELSKPGEKLVLFNLLQSSYQIFFDKQEIETIKTQFKGNELYPYEIKEISSLSEIDIYNYLYCLGRIGIDCAGFSFRFPRAIALQHGVDLYEELGKEWGIKPENVPLNIGTWYYNHWNTERVDDKIINLRPGDLILFPDRRRPVVHSAVIQSIDFQKGRVRYVQCTDWVFNREERGPHDSEIVFYPSFSEKSLSDSFLIWTQKLGPVFEGETCPYGNENDGFRYRLPPYRGKVVRLKRVAELLKKKEPLYYTNLFRKSSHNFS